MQFGSTVIFSALSVAFLLAPGCTEGHFKRQKRFLSPDLWPDLSSALRFGDYARDLAHQISAQTSMAVHRLTPQGSRTVDGRDIRRKEELEDEKPKKGLIRVPVGRETEGDEKEVEVFDPVRKERPQIPSSGGNGGFSPFVPFSFSFGLLAPWWEGPNVCTERSEVEEPEEKDSIGSAFSFNFETTRCIPSESAYTCTKKIQTNGMRKTIMVRRSCCHGYIRRVDGRPGCSALKLENLMDTIKVLEMDKFSKWIDDANLKVRMLTENFTVFTPSNEAITDFEDENEDNEISAIDPEKGLIDVPSTVLNHVVEGYFNTDALENEQLLTTLLPNSNIRINKYQPAHEVVTANCIPISGKNNFATNGIVHLTSGVLPQASKSVGEMMESEDQYSIFTALLQDNGLLEDLKKQDQPWTVFVPTNEAFEKLPQGLRKQIESGEACVQSILHQHLVKGTVCTSAVVSQIRVKNILDNNLQMTRDETEKLRVDGALIDHDNSMGTNGVVHTIDKVLIPPQARSILKALEEEERSDILDLIEAANLLSVFENMQNVTFFVPSKEAMKNLPNETLEEMEKDSELVKKMLLTHLINSHHSGNMFTDNEKLQTMQGHELHLKLHEMLPGIVTGATVQCAYIVNHDNQACGAVIHKINKVLMPPKGSITETLKNMENHGIVMKLLENTELETKLQDKGPFTFLAPTDDAFEKMNDITLEELLENKTKAEEILKLHVLPEMLCCNGISHASPFHRQYVRTYSSSILPVYRGIGERVRFGRARALHCDIPATNGLIHSINRVIQPQRPTTHMFNMDFWPFF